jgi:UDP-glucose 4-epimerase
LDSHSPIVFTFKDYVDVELRIPSVGKAREVLGFEAKIDLEEGIRRTADYYRTRTLR